MGEQEYVTNLQKLWIHTVWSHKGNGHHPMEWGRSCYSTMFYFRMGPGKCLALTICWGIWIPFVSYYPNIKIPSTTLVQSLCKPIHGKDSESSDIPRSLSVACWLKLITLQETNISHLGKGKIIFKHAWSGGLLVLWRVDLKFFFFCVRTGNTMVWVGCIRCASLAGKSDHEWETQHQK